MAGRRAIPVDSGTFGAGLRLFPPTVASLPLEDARVADIIQAAQRNVDETSWPESGVLLWLWALVTTHTTLFLIGSRGREMRENALQDGYHGILMSDGYVAYRAWENRLRG